MDYLSLRDWWRKQAGLAAGIPAAESTPFEKDALIAQGGIDTLPDMSAPRGRLTFEALRAANRAREPHFRNARGGVVHTKPDGSDHTPAKWLQALVGEVGEFACLRRRYEIGDIPEATFKAEAAKELADVQCYLDVLAAQLGIDLGQATMAKFNEVSERIGSNVRLLGARWVRVRVATQASLF